MENLREAQFYTKMKNGRLKCFLCPHYCILSLGKTGLCGVRKNENGELLILNYGLVSALHVDPLEKKPLYHFFPEKTVLSLGSVGCNLSCQFCQNWEIAHPESFSCQQSYFSAEQLVEQAKKKANNVGIAYTYNEPVVFYEFMLDTAKLVHQNNLKNVMVSNGFINKEPLLKLIPYIDAFNIDLKGFTDNFYKKMTKSGLQPILESLKTIYKSGKHLELTNLVIPGLNDDENTFRAMLKWIVANLSEHIVLHLSRYFPQYKLDIAPTNIDVLIKLFKIAKEYLHFVYIGNVHTLEENSTFCPVCGSKLISREGYQTKILALTARGECANCLFPIVVMK